MELITELQPCSNHSKLSVRVLYADTDQMGVVYHATYLRWFEAGRSDYMRRRGLPYLQIEKEGITLPVVEAHAKYHSPAQYDDVLEITTWVSTVSRAQLTFCYLISIGGRSLVTGYTRHASVGPEGRPTRLPNHIKSILSSEELKKKEQLPP